MIDKDMNADKIVTALYRRFKDWSRRGFGPDDVTWCEVKADVISLVGIKGELEAQNAELRAENERLKGNMRDALQVINIPGATKVILEAAIAELEKV